MRIPVILCLAASIAPGADNQTISYQLLATNKTSTMEKEMNAAASSGFSFSAVMGGETGFGGKEVVMVMARSSAEPNASKRYKLLATNKTSTMEKEMQQFGDEGFEYKGQTVFESAFGGREVSVILERDSAGTGAPWHYKLLATSKTSTMEKELTEAGAAGYRLLGMTVSKTAFGGNEVVAILGKH